MPKCPEPGCGREMRQDPDIPINKGGIVSIPGDFYCPATPDQHEIAALKKERDGLKAELEGMNQHLRNIQANIEAAHYGDAHSYIDDLLSLLGDER